MAKSPNPAGALPTPKHLLADEHGPVLDLLADTLITADELAGRWRMETQTLSNLRRARRGVPYIKLPPSGRVRYRLSDVVKAEIAGMRGPITSEMVRMALTGFPGVSPMTREALLRRLEGIVAMEPRD